MDFFFKKKSFKLYLLSTILVIVIAILFYPMISNRDSSGAEEDLEQTTKLVNLAMEKKLILITHYVVGHDTIEIKIENISSIEDIKEKYLDWSITKETDDEIVLERNVEDLSPTLKQGSYFGLGSDGYLTLYREISEGNEIIQTFFRIDIEKLESGLPREPVEQLYQGIPIQDLAEYNSVLSTFSEFSTE